MVGLDGTVLLPRFLLRIGYVRVLDTIVCSGPLVWSFSPAWEAVELTTESCIHLFVCGPQPDLGATIVVAPGQMLGDFLHPQRSNLPLMKSH